MTLKKDIGVLYSHTTPLLENLVHIKYSTIQFDLVGKGLSARLVTKICLIQKVDRSAFLLLFRSTTFTSVFLESCGSWIVVNLILGRNSHEGEVR